MKHAEHSYCHFCGAVHIANDWPRKCRACGNITYRNPLPVIVVLQPVGNFLLVVRRGAGHSAGNLALPGGYLESGETWTEGGARELFEETGVKTDSAKLRACGVFTAKDNSILVFAVAPSIELASLPPFTPTAETIERVVATESIELTYSSHTSMMQRFFAGKLASLEGI